MVDPLVEYYEGVKGLIRDKCGDGAVLILSPPLTRADKLADELMKELGKDKVRHYTIGSEGGREKAKSLADALKRIRGSMMESEGLVVDEELMRELRALLGDYLVGGVKPDCFIPYYISWEEARRYASDENVDEKVRDALRLITKGFESRSRRITWFGLDYIPEKLVEEAMSAKSEDVERWIDAYLYIVSKLNLDGGFLHEVKMVFKRFIGFIETSLPVIGKVMHVVPEPSMQMGAVTLSFINSLAKDEVHAFRDIIDTVRHLKALRSGGDLNTLGKLIAHKLAVDMEIPYEIARNVLVGFAGLADDVLRDIEERLDIIEIKSQSIEGAFRVYDKGGFESDAEAHPGFFIINDELLISGGVIGRSALEPYKVVTIRGFNDLRNEALKRLDNEGVAVLVGPRGIGKTTLATYTTWTLLREGRFRFMVNVKDLEEVGTEFTGFIGYYLGNKYDDKYGNLLVVYDPSTTKTYSLADKKTEAPKGISSTIDTLLRYVAEDERVRSRVRLLMVLPTDIHQALPQDLKNRLGEYMLDLEERGFLRDPEFLAEVIREYAKGCNIDYDKLAGEILAKFSEGYTLIARLAGTLIVSKYECRVDDVERIIEESGGNAHYFILRYINSLFKIHEDPKMAEALVEIFALRRPFVNIARPGVPILTSGVIELIGEKREAKLLRSAVSEELRGWLAHRQHDLIEEAIMKLLDCIVSENEECKDLGDALKPWVLGAVGLLSEVLEKVRDVYGAVEYFADNYGKEFTDALSRFSNCWKRAAFIIGYALAGYPIVPRPEDLPKDLLEDAKYLSDALRECGVDDYLLVGNEIPLLIMNLTKDHAYALTEAFVDKYNEAVAEVSRVRDTARDRGISGAERLYGLGLASIIAKAAELGRPIKPSNADAALCVALFAMLFIASPDYVKSVLRALEPLREKAPHRYLGLLVSTLNIESLDSNTVRYVFDRLNEVLDKYGDVVREYAWSLVHAIRAYADLLRAYLSYFNNEEVEDVVGRVADLLNELGRLSPSLGIIAWAHTLALALWHEDVRGVMEETLGIDVIDKASEVLEELRRLRERVQELMSDEEFRSYVESMSVKINGEIVKKIILEIASSLKHALALYRLKNDELDKAERLFNEAAEEYREIDAYESYLAARGWALRAEVIKGSLVGKELVNKFRQLYEEARKHFMLTARYLGIASLILGNYLVSLALMGDYEMISRLLEEHLWVLNTDYKVSVLTRLMLNALLSLKDRLGGELKGRLVVEPGGLIESFKHEMHSEFLPALMVALGVVKSEDGVTRCVLIKDSIKGVRVVCGDYAIERLRWWLVDDFRESLIERFSQLKELGVNADKLLNMFDELMELVVGLDRKSLVQLTAPNYSIARLVLMLYALANDNEGLTKAHALRGSTYSGKLLSRLFLETYKTCCDPNNDEFRRAIAKLFFLHV